MQHRKAGATQKWPPPKQVFPFVLDGVLSNLGSPNSI